MMNTILEKHLNWRWKEYGAEMDNILRIEFDGNVYAIVIPADYHNSGITFLTDGSYSQQLAFMNHPAGKVIDAHLHNREIREVEYTQEVLVIRKGSLRVDFYNNEQVYLKSIIVHSGDVILLAHGGHGFKVLDELEMVEIKQGPYLGEYDKKRFPSVNDDDVILLKG